MHPMRSGLLAWMLAGVALPATAAGLHSRMDVLDLGMLDTGRPGIVNLWYPQGTCAEPAPRFRLSAYLITISSCSNVSVPSILATRS